MKALIERIKERIALYDLNSLDKNIRRWLAPGKYYNYHWERLRHTDREWVVYRAIELLEAGRSLTEAEQDSLWRLVAKIYDDHALQLHYGLDRLKVPGWKPEYDKFDEETDGLREKLRQHIPYTPWFEGFLAEHVTA